MMQAASVAVPGLTLHGGMVLDARHVTGWALGRTLEAELAVAALRMAVIQGQPSPGLVHQGGRGVQYASHAHTQMLRQYHATGSATCPLPFRPLNPSLGLLRPYPVRLK